MVDERSDPGLRGRDPIGVVLKRHGAPTKLAALSSNSDVLVVQSALDWQAKHAAYSLVVAWNRRMLLQRQVPDERHCNIIGRN